VGYLGKGALNVGEGLGRLTYGTGRLAVDAIKTPFALTTTALDLPEYASKKIGEGIYKRLPKRFTNKAGGAKTHRVYKKDTKKKKSNK